MIRLGNVFFIHYSYILLGIYKHQNEQNVLRKVLCFHNLNHLVPTLSMNNTCNTQGGSWILQINALSGRLHTYAFPQPPHAHLLLLILTANLALRYFVHQTTCSFQRNHFRIAANELAIDKYLRDLERITKNKWFFVLDNLRQNTKKINSVIASRSSLVACSRTVSTRFPCIQFTLIYANLQTINC